MPGSHPPWIDLRKSNARNGANQESSPDLVQAQMAFMVSPKPFSERIAMKWGLEARAAVEESQERTRQLVLSLHNRNFQTMAGHLNYQRKIALRCLSSPETQTLSLCLVASVCGGNQREVQSRAIDFYYELMSTFPTDWFFTPIATEDQFLKYSGANLIRAVGEARSMVEIGRYEASLGDGRTRQYLLGAWQLSPYANEIIWRSLSNSPVPVLFSVMIQPTLLFEIEHNLLHTLANQAQSERAPTPPLAYHREVSLGVGLLQERLKHLRYPYLVQVHLVSSQRVPPFVERVIGSALTYSQGDDAGQPGDFALHPSDNLAYWKEALLNLAPVLGVTGGNPKYWRLRLLSTPEETCAVLRLPYPSEVGLPGVHFVALD